MPSNTDTLLPCPFCGNPAFSYAMDGGYVAECEGCACRTSICDSRGVEAETWNTRTTTDVSTDVLVAELAVFLRNHHIYCTAHDGRFKTAADTLEALQRSNAEKDSRIAELEGELRFAAEALELAGQRYSATRARKVLGDKTP